MTFTAFKMVTGLTETTRLQTAYVATVRKYMALFVGLVALSLLIGEFDTTLGRLLGVVSFIVFLMAVLFFATFVSALNREWKWRPSK